MQDDAVELPDLSEVFAAHGVAVAYLFGSRAEGTARPASDHDVAVLFADPEPALDATVRLAADLARILGTEVDVVDLDRAELELRGHVAERGRLLHSADEIRRVRFEVDARMRWIEFRPVVRETTQAYLRRVAAEGLRPRAGAGLMVAPNLPQPPGASASEASACCAEGPRLAAAFRRLLVMLDRYRSLLAADDPDPYRRRHLVQTAAEISIDLANHVIAADGHRVPRDYGDAFRVLAEVGVLDDGLAARMVALAGVRDLIVHLYAEVDDERLARAVREGGLDDLSAFAARIAALVEP